MKCIDKVKQFFIGVLVLAMVITCKVEDPGMDNDIEVETVASIELPKRSGTPPETTTGIPHIQIGVEPVSEVHEELYRRVYSIPGIERRPSVISGWQGLCLSDQVTIIEPDAFISGREFGHIHDDGSLHIFLRPTRSEEAVETCWAVWHPFAVQQLAGWDGFVMLYTPLSIDELNVTFQLIVDGYNYVTGQKLIATDYY